MSNTILHGSRRADIEGVVTQMSEADVNEVREWEGKPPLASIYSKREINAILTPFEDWEPSNKEMTISKNEDYTVFDNPMMRM